jgi:phosphoserine phosphatase
MSTFSPISTTLCKVRLYVIRHGETEWNKGEVFRGRKDVPLNEVGRQQAEKVGGYFTARPVGRIVSSPLTRAVSTAQPIARVSGVAVETLEEFTDMNFGIWEGFPLRDVERLHPFDLNTWKTAPDKLCLEGAETLAMVRERVRKGLERIAVRENEAIAVVTHRVICKVLVLSCLGIGNDHFWDMKYDPASITLLERQNARYTLIFSNDTCHQEGARPAKDSRDF